MGILINGLATKDYEKLIYKQSENIWEETRENLFLFFTGTTSSSQERVLRLCKSCKGRNKPLVPKICLLD